MSPGTDPPLTALHRTMIAALAVTLLLLLELARRGLEPECPSCGSKDWTAHSTQLHCNRCEASNAAKAVNAPEPGQYEFGLTI